jgi:hypothetical protein
MTYPKIIIYSCSECLIQTIKYTLILLLNPSCNRLTLLLQPILSITILLILEAIIIQTTDPILPKIKEQINIQIKVLILIPTRASTPIKVIIHIKIIPTKDLALPT